MELRAGGSPLPPTDRPPLFPVSNDITTDSFTFEELQHALAELKKGKAAGPDRAFNEELQALDLSNQHTILAMLNECLFNRRFNCFVPFCISLSISRMATIPPFWLIRRGFGVGDGSPHN